MAIDPGFDIGKEFQLPKPLISILKNRGFNSFGDVKKFLYPDFSAIPHPFLMSDLEKGVELVVNAVDKKIPVVVHGDYDVDGVTATAVIVEFCRILDIETYYYIPNRLTDDYGLTVYSVDQILSIIDNREGFLITVDCGISSVEAVKYAKDNGLTVIVTDHHQPPECLPEADALINPKLENCSFPFKELSGAGVAFFFILGLRKMLIDKNYWPDKNTIPNLKQFLDLVALGTVADVMPLVDTNRVLVRAGLEVLNQRKRPGISALCEVCGLHKADRIIPEDISFKIAPRVNAAGRMGNANIAAELLLQQSYGECYNSANELDLLNNQRKKEELVILKEIFKECEQELDDGASGVVIYNERCHPGILGIVASRVVDRFGVPAIVLTRESAEDESTLKGSGRSVKNINIHTKTSLCKQYLNRFGGHPMAVGVSLPKKHLAAFKAEFNHQCQTPCTVEKKEREFDYHIKEKEALNDELIAKLQLFQPFGEGNPEPVFLLKNEKLHNVKEMKDHLKFTVDSTRKKEFTGIGFYMAEKKEIIKKGPVDIIFKVKRTSYRGVNRKEIQLVGVQPAV